MRNGRQHPGIAKLEDQLAEGKLDRREFLRYATLLGLSVTAAYAAVGKITGEAIVPSAKAQELPKGGTLKCGMRVHAVKFPHAHDWQPPSNITLPVCETLTRSDQDNLTFPLLLDRWEVSDDLKTWDPERHRQLPDPGWRPGNCDRLRSNGERRFHRDPCRRLLPQAAQRHR